MVQTIAGFLFSLCWYSLNSDVIVHNGGHLFVPAGLIVFFFAYFFMNTTAWSISSTTWLAIIIGAAVSFPGTQSRWVASINNAIPTNLDVESDEAVRKSSEVYLNQLVADWSTPAANSCLRKTHNSAAAGVALHIQFDGGGKPTAASFQSSKFPEMADCLNAKLKPESLPMDYKLRNRALQESYDYPLNR